MKQYEAGKDFNSLEEVMAEKVVYVVPWKRAHPVSFFLSWQWRLVDTWVKRGLIKHAVKIK